MESVGSNEALAVSNVKAAENAGREVLS